MVGTMKAQLKIQEMAFVLLAFIFLAGIGLLFYVSIRSGGLEQSAQTLAEEGTIGTVASLPSLPGLQGPCPQCLDLDGLYTLLLLNRTSLLDHWDLDYLQIVKDARNITCTSTTYPDCSTLTLTRSTSYGSATRAFVAACFWDRTLQQERCEIAAAYASGRALNA